MKKWNKKIENKLQELMLCAYPVTATSINDEIWVTNKKIKDYI